ncbi:MAG TPA: hypothetical protein VH600_14605 [Burkholderiales bacterium]|jgi:hypothetical protein
MKRVLILLLLAVASSPALAWHGHSRVIVGFNFGVPVYAPWYYYPPPAYYYPPAVYAPPTPTTYVERSEVAEQAPAPAQGPGTWYFCRESNAYYPYVKTCPGGWARVPAQPQN